MWALGRAAKRTAKACKALPTARCSTLACGLTTSQCHRHLQVGCPQKGRKAPSQEDRQVDRQVDCSSSSSNLHSCEAHHRHRRLLREQQLPQVHKEEEQQHCGMAHHHSRC